MAKKTKSKNTDTKVNVNLDEFVNEGKNLTEEVVAEETAKAAEVKKKLVEETAKETDVPESWKKCAEELNNLKTTDTPNKELEKLYEPMAMANDNTTEDVAQVEQIEEETAKEGEVTDNIDDVIAECTGKTDEKVEEKNEEKKTTKDDEPWYVARAMRDNDYFNW